MSVESGVCRQLAAPSNSRASPIARCVCSLCNCGRHSCRSTPVEWATGKEAASPGAATNRCAAAAAVNTGSQVEESGQAPDWPASKMDGTEGCRLDWQDQDRYCAHLKTDCLDERYLGSKSAVAKQSSPSSDEQLLHVLVSRPAIAGKPRDNILFEGEMDLKTTFETSYEALAKMRLEHWRRHQAELEKRRRRATPVAANTHGQMETSGQVSVNCRKDAPVAAAKPLGLSRSPAYGTPAASMVERQTQTPSGELTSKQLGHQEDQIPQPGNPIDPDLSPIIVYNANLNRLEQVGLRRRSKYRPSTSLRPGTRGLFGDQEPLDGQSERRSGGKNTPESRQVGAGLMSSHRRTPTEESADGRQTVVLNKRNLVHSDQPNYLTFSAHNLPVDSKRRLDDNVNMVDHIRNHNLIDSSSKDLPSPQTGRQSQTDLIAAPNEQERRVAEQEEAEAVAEIQRLMPENKEEQQPSSAAESVKDTQQSSRLQRTCQNKNFNIFLDRLSQDAASLPVGNGPPPITSPQLRVYNNLFRESPDFILTTGKYLEQEARQDERHSETTDVQAADDIRSARGEECRVLKLERDFLYVGSQLGHEYFVENAGNLENL